MTRYNPVMHDRSEHTGLIGVGFLFGFISLFLLVVCLKAAGHASLAAESGLGGSALLAVAAGWVLLRKWRQASGRAAFDEDGDVPFCAAVLLLASIALAGGLARAAGLSLSGVVPLVCLLLGAAAIPAGRFVRNARRHR